MGQSVGDIELRGPEGGADAAEQDLLGAAAAERKAGG